MKAYISSYYLDNIAMRRKSNLRLVTVHLPEAYLDGLKQLVHELKRYPSRSEAIRTAVRDLLLQHDYFTKRKLMITA